jgi:ATP-dependent RNA helicase RhlE
LVFTRTKHGADKLVRSLHGDGIGAVALHGNKSQNARTKALADFKAGAVEVMVATDIAARGIDIDQLPHVVNYDLPNVPEDYVHRIGRTGRAGADGEAISLVCVDEHEFLRDIERLIKRSIPKEVIAGFEPDPNAVAQPVFTQRGRRPAQPGASGASRKDAQGKRAAAQPRDPRSAPSAGQRAQTAQPKRSKAAEQPPARGQARSRPQTGAQPGPTPAGGRRPGANAGSGRQDPGQQQPRPASPTRPPAPSRPGKGRPATPALLQRGTNTKG